MTGAKPPQGRDNDAYRYPTCGAKTRSEAAGGGPCRRPAGWGTPHPGDGPCKLHGGNTRNHAHAAEQRAATAAVVTYGARRDIEPAAALLDLVACSAGHVAWLAARVAEVDAKALTVGVAEQRIDAAGEKTVIIRSAPNIWLDLYHRERRFLADVCTAALRAGVEDRAVRLAERQGELLTVVIAALIADETLGLTEGQRAAAVAAVPGHLRAVADAETAGLGWSGRRGDGRSGERTSG